MSRITTIEFPVFSDFIIHVETSSNFDKTISKYPDISRFADGSTKNADAITIHNDDSNVVFMFLKPNVSTGTIAHESWHALSHMFQTVGVDMDSETVAYHLGFLVDNIFRFLRGRRG